MGKSWRLFDLFGEWLLLDDVFIDARNLHDFSLEICDWKNQTSNRIIWQYGSESVNQNPVTLHLGLGSKPANRTFNRSGFGCRSGTPKIPWFIIFLIKLVMGYAPSWGYPIFWPLSQSFDGLSLSSSHDQFPTTSHNLRVYMPCSHTSTYHIAVCISHQYPYYSYYPMHTHLSKWLDHRFCCPRSLPPAQN